MWHIFELENAYNFPIDINFWNVVQSKYITYHLINFGVKLNIFPDRLFNGEINIYFPNAEILEPFCNLIWVKYNRI